MSFRNYQIPDFSDLREVASCHCYADVRGPIQFPSIEGFCASNLFIVENDDPTDKNFYVYMHKEMAEIRYGDNGISCKLEHPTGGVDNKIAIEQAPPCEFGLPLPPEKSCLVLSGPQGGLIHKCTISLAPNAFAIIEAPIISVDFNLGQGSHVQVKPHKGHPYTIGHINLNALPNSNATATVDAQDVSIRSASNATLRADIKKTEIVIAGLIGENSRIVTSGQISKFFILYSEERDGKSAGQLCTHIGQIVQGSILPKKDDPRFSYISMPRYSRKMPKFG